MPSLNAGPPYLQYLTYLNYSPEIETWYNSYDTKGYFSTKMCAAAHGNVRQVSKTRAPRTQLGSVPKKKTKITAQHLLSTSTFVPTLADCDVRSSRTSEQVAEQSKLTAAENEETANFGSLNQLHMYRLF